MSTWQVTLPTQTEAGALFTTDSFARLEVVLDGAIWRSGPVSHLERTVDLDGDMLQVSGVGDMVWLARRNAHPQPGSAAPPYSTTGYDIHTCPMSVRARRAGERQPRSRCHGRSPGAGVDGADTRTAGRHPGLGQVAEPAHTAARTQHDPSA